ncbi:MAG: class II glutamine amidotransferase [Myxococcota bacterium]|jgi:glutamine amidotransferase|nr:class II glutamine amidotransferase [Myxococcota bacterium]
MSRLFAYLGNDPVLLCEALDRCGNSLCCELGEAAQGWGVGYYHDERALVHKRPGAIEGHCDLRELCAELQSMALIAHLRQAVQGAVSPENTQPFRFRNWLFAHIGQVTHSADANQALHERLPNFLQHNINGVTDSELALHFFFASLRDYGRVDREILPVQQLLDAGTRTVRALKSTLEDASQRQTPQLDMLFCSGRMLVAINHGPARLFNLRFEGLENSVRGAAEGFRAQLLAFDAGSPGEHDEAKPQWRELPANSIVVIDENFELHVEVS